MPGGTVERWEALRLALGARGALPREVGTLIPPPRVPRKHPGASHRSIPSRGSRGTGKPRTHCAARTRKVGCLNRRIEIEARRLLNLAPHFRGERSTRIVRCASGEGPGTAPPNEKAIGSKGLQLNKYDPRVRGLHLPQCLAPHPKPSLRFGFDLSPRERGEVKKALRPGTPTLVQTAAESAS